MEKQGLVDFRPTPYQNELLEKALNRNVIVYLKTGAGKTYIAVMLIKEKSHEITKPYNEGGMRTIFLANTVPLVKQQAAYLQKTTGLKTGCYFGDQKIDDKFVDFWDKEIWQRELDKNYLLVMIPQILVDCIEHSFIDLKRINIVIFDECHHATGNHPYSRLINMIIESKSECRILGLTASIVHKKCSLTRFNNHLKKLEDKFNCKVETSSLMYDDTNIDAETHINLKKPKIIVLNYDSSFEKELQISKIINQFKMRVDDLCTEQSQRIKDQKRKLIDENEPDMTLEKDENPFTKLKKKIANLESALIDLGIWSFKHAFQAFLDQESKSKYMDENENITEFTQSLQLINDLIVNKITDIGGEVDNEADKISVYSSDKVSSLLHLLKIYANEQRDRIIPTSFSMPSLSAAQSSPSSSSSHFKSLSSNLFHAIIFVERKHTAYYLNKLFQKLHDSNPEEWSFLKSDFVCSCNRTEIDIDIMNPSKQERVLEKFRKREINILVATNIVEEGVDIPECNLIVRFSKIPNFGSFVQSKGRARSKDSRYVIMVDKSERETFNRDLADFILIERDVEGKLLGKTNEDDDDDSQDSCMDDVEWLNKNIPPYARGNAKITCHSAISLINRYCTTLEQETCSVLYPIFDITSSDGLFVCSLRLPPNSAITETVISARLKRKKYAKMDAALKMCRILDEKGQLTDDLTILSTKDWIEPHCGLIEDERDAETNKKLGSTKNKRSYTIKFADEFENNHVKVNQDSYLYAIELSDSRLTFRNGSILGFLSSKNFESAPEFKLYDGANEINVQFNNINQKRTLNQTQYDILKNFNSFVFVKLLRAMSEFNLDESIGGGLFVILNKDNAFSYDIDWLLLGSFETQLTVLEKCEQLKQQGLSDSTLKDFVVKFPESNRIMAINEIDHDLSPWSEFPEKSKAATFADYFRKKYQIETNVRPQNMLVHLDYVDRKKNFLLKIGTNGNDDQTSTMISKKQKRKNARKVLFIAEHLDFYAFKFDELSLFMMIPDIFHRTNTLFKARKFQLLIENKLVAKLNIPKRVSNLGWNESIRFHKLKNSNSTNDQPSAELDSSLEKTCVNVSTVNTDSEPEEKFVLVAMGGQQASIEGFSDATSSTQVPELIVKENIDNQNYSFPNVYNLLQCFTLKTAVDNFDLERYEIIGDCFLKLVSVMQIYLDFFKEQEGRMVKLKSMRVSNHYLYNLASKKSLNEYIVSENCLFKDTFVYPYTNHADEKLKLKLSDKSLADCVEALIGVYLINLGTRAAKIIIEWLEFVLSDQLGNVNFSCNNIQLPDPVVNKEGVDKLYKRLENRFDNFENFLGYKFRNKVYLYQAFTHPSYVKNPYTSSYQKLELVGDAVLDFLVTQYIFSQKNEYSPGELTDLRQALVNNNFFGHLAVKHQFDVLLDHSSPDLDKILNNYRKKHELCSPDTIYIQDNDDCEELEIEPPKCLADIFESVAGAIYLDSNMCLQTVWQAYYKIFQPYFVAFKKNLPQSPIKALHQLKPNSKIDIRPCESTSELIEVILTIDGVDFIGKGENMRLAKKHAMKKAVRKFQNSNENILFF